MSPLNFGVGRTAFIGVVFLINTPTITNTNNVLSSTGLQSSTFSSNILTATHTSSQWQISLDSDFSNIIYDSGTTIANLTSITVSLSNYGFSNTWNGVVYARVRYTGLYNSISQTSSWSSGISISAATLSVLFELIGGGGNTAGRGGGGGGGGAERKITTKTIYRGLPITTTVAGGGGVTTIEQLSNILDSALAGGVGVGEFDGGSGACGGGAGSQNRNWTGGSGTIGGRGGNASGWGDWTGAGGGGGGMSAQGQDGAVNLPGNGGAGVTSWWGDTVCGGGAGGGWNLSSTKYRSGADGGGDTTVSGSANRGGGGGGCTTTGSSPGTGSDISGGAGGSGRITVNIPNGYSYTYTGSPQISGTYVRFNGTATITIN